ncbi:MAG: FAD-dependent oxidoreductase [Solobacterium sp.]|jgi:fumarate reductase flavoprotein subunit|nr:FAD-dependent oxidoreductase [Solobacterium sp.]MCH4265878.1 FAD-dependent oxidoreductase [Solobacterium sp.]
MRHASSKVLASLIALTMVGCTSGTASSTASSSAQMKEGTYTATARGMNDDIEVTVELTADAIKSVTVTSDSETPGIGGQLKDSNGNVVTAGGLAPVDEIPQDIVAQQSIAVDNVTGATITSAAIKNAVADCLTQAGADSDSWKKEVTYTGNTDATADVVVVGGGGAGLAAAIEAAQSGKSVIVVEKNGETGGDTLVCGAIYNTPDQALQSEVTMTDAVKTTIEKALAETPVSDAHAELQAEVQAQWDEYKASGRTDLFDSQEWYALQTWINGDKVGNLDLVKVLCYNAYDGLQWIESMGMEFSDTIGQGAGALWQRTHTSKMSMGTGFLSVYNTQLEEMKDKITLMNESTGESLVTDDTGKVTGVVCKNNRSGDEFTVTGTDGVILSTGGFAANSSMVQEYNTSGKWDDLSKVATTNRYSCSQGDGIGMATGVGASLTDMDEIQLLYLGNTKDGQLTKYPPRDVNGTDQIIFINANGERFVNEGDRRDVICLAVLQQPDAMFYMLESGDGDKYKDITDPEWRSADGFTFQYLSDNGYIVYDDTLAGLAEKLGMDATTLQNTVDTFNASVDSGTDEFGRTLFSTKLENGPWVATARQACVHHTMGGVTIDTSARVLDESGNPISGLYAAGEITGGIHGANRLGGNAVVDTVVFGKLAADSLVSDTK